MDRSCSVPLFADAEGCEERRLACVFPLSVVPWVLGGGEGLVRLLLAKLQHDHPVSPPWIRASCILLGQLHVFHVLLY